MASSAPKGSSMSRMSAPCASARARATRCRIPPDSSCGRRSPKPSRRTVDSNASARSRRSRAGTPAKRIASSTFSRAVSHGKSAASWKRRLTRPLTSIEPACTRSSPASRFRRVVFPQPEAPTRQTNSPRCDRHRHVPEGEHVVAARAVDLVKAMHLDGGRPEGSVDPRDDRLRRWPRSRRWDLRPARLAQHLVEERQVVDARRDRPGRGARGRWRAARMWPGMRRSDRP